MFSKEELNTFYRYCISLTGDENSAWDLLQSCLEKYVKHETFEVIDSKAYFRRMIRNQFIDDQRREGNQQYYELDEEKTVIQIDLKSLDNIIVESSSKFNASE